VLHVPWAQLGVVLYEPVIAIPFEVHGERRVDQAGYERRCEYEQ